MRGINTPSEVDSSPTTETVPASAANAPEDLTTTDYEGVEMAEVQSIRIPRPLDTTADHSRPHFDGCPDCGNRWNIPTNTRPDVRGNIPGCISTYTCHQCDHSWTCSWACDGVG